MENPKHKLIYEFEGTRNLYTDPIDTGDILDGDVNDYFMEMKITSDSLSYIFATPNNDTSSVRRYYMYGTGSTATGVANDSYSHLWCALGGLNNNPVVNRMLITGSVGEERHFDQFHNRTESATFHVEKTSYYWKNTLDNLKSLQFLNYNSTTCDITIRIYEIPKTQNLDNYDLIEEVVFENRSTDIVFDGLDGDSDEEYLMVNSISAGGFYVRPNGDNTTSITTQRLYNNTTGGITSSNNSSVNNWSLDGDNKSCSIFAKSGKERLITISESDTDGTNRQYEKASWYPNTIDNFTSFVLENYSSSTGKVSLYKRKSNKTIDPVPMVTVAEIDVNGDMSAGYTISGIKGDSIDGAIKIEYVGEQSNTIQLQLNTSSGPYTIQTLNATNSNVSASGSSSYSYIPLAPGGASVNEGSWFLYPKSGQNRPLLGSYMRSSSVIEFDYAIFPDSINEINELFLYTATTANVKGKIRISIPKQSANTCGTFTVTKN